MVPQIAEATCSAVVSVSSVAKVIQARGFPLVNWWRVLAAQRKSGDRMISARPGLWQVRATAEMSWRVSASESGGISMGWKNPKNG